MGHYHDLDAIMQELCASYFPQCTEVAISWGRWGGRVRPRSIRFGVYQPQKQVIRIHPALDQAFVPRYFVEFIVYHELLHHVIPPIRINGRYGVHSAAFRRRERAFPRYAEAIAWRKQHLRRLLESNRRGHL
jgi:predicted metal-dependent hydrolase